MTAIEISKPAIVARLRGDPFPCTAHEHPENPPEGKKPLLGGAWSCDELSRHRNGMSLGQYVGPTWPRGEPGIRVRILLNRLDAAVGRREAEVARLLEVRKRR